MYINANLDAPSTSFFNLICSPLLEVLFVTEIYLIVDQQCGWQVYVGYKYAHNADNRTRQSR